MSKSWTIRSWTKAKFWIHQKSQKQVWPELKTKLRRPVKKFRVWIWRDREKSKILRSWQTWWNWRNIAYPNAIKNGEIFLVFMFNWTYLKTNTYNFRKLIFRAFCRPRKKFQYVFFLIWNEITTQSDYFKCLLLSPPWTF